MTERDEPADLDRVLKILAREFPQTLFRLAGIDVSAVSIHPEDVTVNVREARGDRIFRVEEGGRVRRALYFEFQLQPRQDELVNWFLKCAGFTRQVGVPVFLVVIYLTRGRSARFPDSYAVRWGPLLTEFRFNAVRLWEHADRIRSGELAELAPLLVLCEDNPDPTVLEEEKALIRRLDLPDNARGDLLGLAVMAGLRYFSRDLLAAVFAEELPMLKALEELAKIMEEAGLTDRWAEPARAQGLQEGLEQGLERGLEQGLERGLEQGLERGLEQGLERGLEQGLERGLERGLEQGLEQGLSESARRLALRLLTERFGTLPQPVVDRVQQASVEWCEELAVRLLRAGSLEELGL